MKQGIVLLILVFFFFNGCKGEDKAQVSPPKKPAPRQMSPQPQEPPAPWGGQEELTGPTGENSPPLVTSVTVTPRSPTIGDTVVVNAEAVDNDGDFFTLVYEWTLNGDVLPEETKSLFLSEEFRRGDRIKLTVTPDDGKEKGTPGFMNLTIGNSPPVITSAPQAMTLQEGQYTYQVNATDRDNDGLTFSLVSAPEGMSIDSESGLIDWRPGAGDAGKHTITISVTDDFGGEAVQSFVLQIGSGQ